MEFVPSGDDRVVMRKRRTIGLQELFGALPTNGMSLTLEEIDEAIADACAGRDEHSRS